MQYKIAESSYKIGWLDEVINKFFNSTYCDRCVYEKGQDNWESIQASGLGDNNLYGAGFNLGTGNLILNDSMDTGKYADGIAIPEPADITGDGIVDINDLKELCSQWLEVEQWYE